MDKYNRYKYFVVVEYTSEEKSENYEVGNYRRTIL